MSQTLRVGSVELKCDIVPCTNGLLPYADLGQLGLYSGTEKPT